MNRQMITSNLISFCIGAALGGSTVFATVREPAPVDDAGRPSEPEPCTGSDSTDSTDSGSSSSDSDSGDSTGPFDDVAAVRAPSYCAAFPHRCNVQAPCDVPKVQPDGSVLGGCFQAEYVCCSTGVGCWAVGWPSMCENMLFWSDCEAGESAIDPDTGEAIIICHD